MSFSKMENMGGRRVSSSVCVMLEMSISYPSGDFKWAGMYMYLKFRVFLGSLLGVISVKMVFRAIGTNETTYGVI